MGCSPYLALPKRSEPQAAADIAAGTDRRQRIECSECFIDLSDMDGWQKLNRMCRHCARQS